MMSLGTQERFPLVFGIINHLPLLVVFVLVCVPEPGSCNGLTLLLSYGLIFGLSQVLIELVIILWLGILLVRGAPLRGNLILKILYLFTLALLPLAAYLF